MLLISVTFSGCAISWDQKFNVHVEHEIYEDCASPILYFARRTHGITGVHVFQAFVFLEASRQALLSIRRFVKRGLPAHQAKASKEIDESKLDAEVMGDAHAVRPDDGELDSKTLPQSPGQTKSIKEKVPEECQQKLRDHRPRRRGDARACHAVQCRGPNMRDSLLDPSLRHKVSMKKKGKRVGGRTREYIPVEVAHASLSS